MLDDTGVDSQKLRIIEWQHLDLLKFYPMALATSWSVRGLLYPLSVVKSRLQLQKQNNVYSGMRHAFVDIIRNEGIVTLYRGFWITLPQLSASFIYSTIYEKFRNVLHINANVQSVPVVSALAGGCASVFTQFIFVPTDIISQHMMIHNNPAKFVGSAQNVAVLNFVRADRMSDRLTLGIRVIRAVYYIDGIRGFYRGFWSSLFLYIPSSMVFWSSYYNFLTLLKSLRVKRKSNEKKSSLIYRGDSENLLLLQAISGALGGVCAAVFTNPLEVLRVRIQVHRTDYWETIRRLYHFEGFGVFSKGLAPRMISNGRVALTVTGHVILRNLGINSCLIMTGYEMIKRLCVLPEYRNAIVW